MAAFCVKDARGDWAVWVGKRRIFGLSAKAHPEAEKLAHESVRALLSGALEDAVSHCAKADSIPASFTYT